MTTAKTIPLLEVEGLRIAVHGVPQAEILRGVSLAVERGETLAIVGESGCGKSVTSLAIMGLLPEGLKKCAGTVFFDGKPLPTDDNEAMRKFRGRRIGMVFQEPMAALNPVFTVGDQVAEVILEHEPVRKAEAMKRVVELLEKVGLPDPARIAHEYPHRLSGGQRQRVVIAMALACRPELLIADEPTTALDVTVQAQIMRLLKELQQELGIAIVLITHNLGLVAQTADRVAVMYAGRIVEEADTRALFVAPQHPYTVGLLNATPRPGRRKPGQLPLTEIPGMVPSIMEDMRGCRFRPRCAVASALCGVEIPALRRVGASEVACHYPYAASKEMELQ
jgi:peptide/nickel transport system ATP-binding protein